LGLIAVGYEECLLHEALEEEVHMEIFSRFETHSGRNNVCLLKAFYGLK